MQKAASNDGLVYCLEQSGGRENASGRRITEKRWLLGRDIDSITWKSVRTKLDQTGQLIQQVECPRMMAHRGVRRMIENFPLEFGKTQKFWVRIKGLDRQSAMRTWFLLKRASNRITVTVDKVCPKSGIGLASICGPNVQANGSQRKTVTKSFGQA